MADYIKREDAINALCLSCNERNSEEPCEPSDCEIMVVLKHLPSADVAPVKRGKWYWRGFNIVCSECGCEPYFERTEKPNYCPNCGAEMEVEG